MKNENHSFFSDNFHYHLMFQNLAKGCAFDLVHADKITSNCATPCGEILIFVPFHFDDFSLCFLHILQAHEYHSAKNDFWPSEKYVKLPWPWSWKTVKFKGVTLEIFHRKSVQLIKAGKIISVTRQQRYQTFLFRFYFNQCDLALLQGDL